MRILPINKQTLLLVLFTGSLFSCTKEDIRIKTKSAEVTFSFDQFTYDDAKTAEESFLEYDELIAMANDSDLFLEITLNGEDEPLILKMKTSSSDEIISVATTLALKEGSSTYYIDKALMKNAEGDVLYSGVTPSSVNKNIVSDDELMTQKRFSLLESDRYKTKNISLTMLKAK